MKRAFYWSRHHLFSSWYNTLLTFLALGFLYFVIPPIFSWIFFDANWQGQSIHDCQKAGACWPFVLAHFDQFMYGFYPEAERYRVNLSGILLIAMIAQWFLKHFPIWLKCLNSVVLLSIVLVLLVGGLFGLAFVPTALWGGLFLTLFLSMGSIIFSFPIALLLALGRYSSIPIVKSVCVIFIEIVRGVPLITVLYMASVMLPMFLPQDIDLNKLLRAFLGITFFQAAYLAEVIRGGLNGIPKGQYEAAKSIGLSYWPMMGLIVLPQALKMMIPGIVNTFIGLFKDTTLVLIIGLFDFLGIIQAALSNPQWLGSAFEGYVFCACIYWIFCYSMSYYSRKLERKLGKS